MCLVGNRTGFVNDLLIILILNQLNKELSFSMIIRMPIKQSKAHNSMFSRLLNQILAIDTYTYLVKKSVSSKQNLGATWCFRCRQLNCGTCIVHLTHTFGTLSAFVYVLRARCLWKRVFISHKTWTKQDLHAKKTKAQLKVYLNVKYLQQYVQHLI